MQVKRIFLILFVCISFRSLGQQPAPAYNPSVLIELFSSEGCSSCPFADEFMQEILRLADSTSSPVFVLDYHVDIWDRSGWVDRFSDSLYSERQSIYMKKVNQQALFTPMVFVNGKMGAAAGMKKEIGQAIYKTMSAPSQTALILGANMQNDGKGITLTYKVERPNNKDSLQICFALTLREASTKVTGGENVGKTLTHHNIVRKLYTVPLNSPSGEFTLPIDPSLDLSQYNLTAFVQKTKTWEVLATDQLVFRK